MKQETKVVSLVTPEEKEKVKGALVGGDENV